MVHNCLHDTNIDAVKIYRDCMTQSCRRVTAQNFSLVSCKAVGIGILMFHLNSLPPSSGMFEITALKTDTEFSSLSLVSVSRSTRFHNPYERNLI